MNKGFTLIELLVVISIIAILSVVGMTLYSSVTNNAKDTKKRADVDAIAAAYEQHYDPTDSKYPVLQDDWFNSKIPKTPTGDDYSCLLTSRSPSFNICAVLSNGLDVYCKGSAYGDPVSCSVAQAGGSGSPSPSSSSTSSPSSNPTSSPTSSPSSNPGPNAPTNLTATPVTGNEIDLGWTQPSGTVTGYKIYYCTGSNCTLPSSPATTLNGAANAYPATHQYGIDISCGTTYNFGVKAFNSSGDSPVSNIASANSTACPQASSKYVFVTSRTFTGDLKSAAISLNLNPLNGLNAGDKLCKYLADNSSTTNVRNKNWMAWLSDSTGSPSTRFTKNSSYKLVNDVVVATSWTDLTTSKSGSYLRTAINITESGGTPPTTSTSNDYNTLVFTNTNTNGNIWDSNLSCSNWESTSGGTLLGEDRSTGIQYTAQTLGSPCNLNFLLYCFEQ